MNHRFHFLKSELAESTELSRKHTQAFQFLSLLCLLWIQVALPGPCQASSGFEVAQGTLLDTSVSNQWTSFTFLTSFGSTPLVFALGTDQGADPCAIRVTNITTSGFQASCLEPFSEDGTHEAMDFHYLAIEPGLYDLPLAGGGTMTVEAGFIDTTTVQHRCGGGCGATGWDSVTFNALFTAGLTNVPAVLTQIQGLANETNNGASPSAPFLTTAVRNGSTTTTGFQVALERAEAATGSVSQNERLGWFAMPAEGTCNTFDLGAGGTTLFEAVVTPRDFNGWDNGCDGSSTFSCSFSGSPVLIGSKSSRQGNNGGWLRRCALSSTAVTFTVDEDRENDTERNHVDEVASYVAFGAPVSTTVPLYTLVADFSLHPGADQTIAAWRSSGESGAASYQLMIRRPGGALEPLHAKPIPALLSAPQGAHYQIALDPVEPVNGAEYWIIEVGIDGERTSHGPLRPGPVPNLLEHDPSSSENAFLARPVATPPNPTANQPAPIKVSSPSSTRAPTTANIGVSKTGLHGVSWQQLAEAFGLPESDIEDLARRRMLALSHNGLDVAWKLDAANHRLLFFGQESSDPLTAQAVYQLRRSVAGSTIKSLRVRTGAGDPQGTFRGQVELEQNRFFVTAIPLDPRLDLWMWQGFHSGFPDFAVGRFDFDLEAYAGSSDARVEIVLQGAAQRPDGLAHRVGLEINGYSLGEQRFFDFNRSTLKAQVPSHILQATGNQLRIEALGGLPASEHSLFFLDRFEVVYDRSYDSVEPQFIFRPSAGEGVEAGGAGISTGSDPHRSNLLLFSLENPRRPLQLMGFQELEKDDLRYVRFQARSAAEHLLTVDAEIKAPTAVWAAQVEDLRRHSGAEYLVVAPKSWNQAARALAAWRRADGLSSAVIAIEQIYDQFAFGHQDPRALEQFLHFAYQNWTLPPRYVVLLGDGHLDYQSHGDSHPNPMPPRLVATSEGIFASDGVSADFNGDGAPEIAIGRLPITSEEQLYAWLGKLEVWESSDAAWKSEALFVGDLPDHGGNFTGAAHRLAAHLTDPSPRPDPTEGPWNPQVLAISELGFDATRDSLLEVWKAGAGFITWIGHGGSDRWARGGVLSQQDVPELNAEQRSAVVVALGCNTNRFALPGFSSLGGDLTLHPNGGAIAVWAPSGATRLNQMFALGEGWTQALRNPSPDQRLGDRILTAIEHAVEHFGTAVSSETLGVYVLFGDPATRIR